MAVGPPTSWMFPLKPRSFTRPAASRTSDARLRAVTIRPWWNAREQKEHAPKQPLLDTRLKRTSSSAGTPPKASYREWDSRV